MYENLIKSVIVDNIEEGIIIFDTSLNIVYANNRCKEKLGILDENIIGVSLFSIFKSVTANESHIIKVFETGEPLIGYYDEIINLRGRKVNLFNSTYPIKENGRTKYVIDLYREINGYYEMENRIKILQTDCKNVEKSNINIRENNGTTFTLDNFIGKSKSIKELKYKINSISNSDSSVLVYGETGTGKEVLVQSIHNLSKFRSCHPFIAQNCAALPNTLLESILFGVERGSYTDAVARPGLFELANNGTLFLDEINSMDIDLQGKLLRVLEDGIVRRIGSINIKNVNTRVIASTNVRPCTLLEHKKIRKDLFYRLNAIFLEIPPLRERKDDIEELAYYYINFYNNKYNRSIKKISNKVMDMFINYQWPGNVRELQNVIESSVGITEDVDIICVESLSDSFLNKLLRSYNTIEILSNDLFERSLNENLAIYEVKLIKEKIVESNGNISAAAKLLGLPRQTLFSKIKKYNIEWDVNIK
ncbi:MAG: sigma 54-interacting transcriptional regulator [Tissierellia bacterium]|nr:sigma 54-interacting transcriptional regulator [Tissierellia bacterium]